MQKFGSKMARKWRELAPFFLRATGTAPLFLALAPPRRATPFLVRASGAVVRWRYKWRKCPALAIRLLANVAQLPTIKEIVNKCKDKSYLISRKNSCHM